MTPDDAAPPPAKNSPVSLRLGALEDAVQARRQHEEGAAVVVRRDLERYYRLLQDAGRAELLFTAEQAITLALLAGDGALDLDASSYKYLWAEVERQLDFWRVDEDHPFPKTLDRPVLVERLKGLTLAGSLALLDRLERYRQCAVLPDWRFEVDVEALASVGLISQEKYDRYLEMDRERRALARAEAATSPVDVGDEHAKHAGGDDAPLTPEEAVLRETMQAEEASRARTARRRGA